MRKRTRNMHNIRVTELSLYFQKKSQITLFYYCYYLSDMTKIESATTYTLSTRLFSLLK